MFIIIIKDAISSAERPIGVKDKAFEVRATKNVPPVASNASAKQYVNLVSTEFDATIQVIKIEKKRYRNLLQTK